jgi:hypothetical protein
MDMDYFRSTDLRYNQDNMEMDDDSSLEEYFQNYVPLSNLPTPPPSSATSSPREDNLDTKESYMMGKFRFFSSPCAFIADPYVF